jgi:hypothetical protein
MTRKVRSIAVVVICLSAAILALNLAGKCSATYQQGFTDVTYSCMIANPSFKEFTMNMTYNISASSYIISMTPSVSLPNYVEAYIKANAVASIESMPSLPAYYTGERDSSWMSEKAVYNDTGGMLRVYGVDTSILYMMKGNVTISGVNTFIYMMRTTPESLSSTGTSIISVMVVVGVIVVAAFATFIAYSFFIRRRMIINKQLRRVDKSGSKLRKYQEKKQDTTGNVKKKNGGTPLREKIVPRKERTRVNKR